MFSVVNLPLLYDMVIKLFDACWKIFLAAPTHRASDSRALFVSFLEVR